MNRQADISVIVPCYNAQKYLDVCLESLRAQKKPEIEFILIDDGSADDTGVMLDRFAREEPRARVLHVVNGGVSSARNKGLSMAKGRYIAFMDADDALEENSLLKLYRKAETSGAQITSANHRLFDMNCGQRICVQTDPVEQKPGQIVREIIHMHRIYNNIWNKLYVRALFDGLSLDEDVRIGEDALLNLQLYLRAQRVAHIEDYTYVYRVHGGSAMANVRSHSEAHQPMLKAMSRILLREGMKERYFRDYLQSCIWIDEKERGIRACMKTFDARVRPLALEGIDTGRIPGEDKMLYRIVKSGAFPVFYQGMRIIEKLTGKRWGIRR